MVRMLKVDSVIGENGKHYVEIAGTSSDTKPIEEKFATGSVFLEVDTSMVYLFDEESNDWVEVGGSGE